MPRPLIGWGRYSYLAGSPAGKWRAPARTPVARPGAAAPTCAGSFPAASPRAVRILILLLLLVGQAFLPAGRPRAVRAQEKETILEDRILTVFAYRAPSCAPVGDLVAYVADVIRSDGSTGHDLYVMSLDGQMVRRLSSQSEVSGPCLSRMGDRVVCAAVRSTGAARRGSEPGASALLEQGAPRGTIADEPLGPQVRPSAQREAGLYSLSTGPSGGAPLVLLAVAPRLAPFAPVFSPDDNTVAYIHYESGASTPLIFWTADMRTGLRKPHPLPKDVTISVRSSFGWMPDGTHLRFLGSENRRGEEVPGLWEIDLSNDWCHRIREFPRDAEVSSLALSPDGRRLAYYESGSVGEPPGQVGAPAPGGPMGVRAGARQGVAPPGQWALPRQDGPWECARERAICLPGSGPAGLPAKTERLVVADGNGNNPWPVAEVEHRPPWAPQAFESDVSWTGDSAGLVFVDGHRLRFIRVGTEESGSLDLSRRNLAALYEAFSRYAREHNGSLPSPSHDPAHYREDDPYFWVRELEPYLPSKSVLYAPADRDRANPSSYRLNPAMRGVLLESRAAIERRALLSEEQSYVPGHRLVLYSDGRIRDEPE